MTLTPEHLGRRVNWQTPHRRYTGMLFNFPEPGYLRAQVLTVDGWCFPFLDDLVLVPHDDRRYSADEFLAAELTERLEHLVEEACRGIYHDHEGYWPSACERARIASALVAVAGKGHR